MEPAHGRRRTSASGKSTELRRQLADAGLEISAGKMSALWTGTPTTIRLDDLDIICAVLDCEPSKLLIREPDKVAARRAAKTANGEQPSLRTHRDPAPARPQPHPSARMTAGLILDSTTKDAAESGAPRRTKVGMWKPKPCLGCRSNVVAWTKPRVDYCYQCLPGGPFPPPAVPPVRRHRTTTG